MQWYWTATGTAGEGTGWVRRALAATAPADREPEVRAARTRAMAACAFLCVFPARLEAAREFAHAAVERGLAEGDPASAGWGELVLGLSAEVSGRPDSALTHLRAGLEHFEASDDRYGEQQLLSILASTLWAVGRREESAACVHRGMRVASTLGETWHRPYLSWVLSLNRVTERRLTGPDGALAHARAVLEPQRVFADPRALALGHDALAHSAWLLGRHEDAARLFGASQACWPHEETTLVAYRTDPLGTEECVADLRAVLGEEGYARAWEEGARTPPEDALERSIRFAADAM
jgi:non-specific serine/threonine protein kinase